LVPAAVTYDDATRTATLNPNANLAGSATYTATLSGARDAAGNTMAPLTWSFTTGSGSAITNATIFSASATPAVLSDADASAVELGMKFRSDRDGYITGVRFYKGAGNTGTHVGKLWSSTGTLLASVTFINETGSGWQQANFSTPVAVTAGTTYIVSYYAPVGHYSATSDFFSGGGTTSGALTALGSGVEGGNGVYRYGAGGGFPTDTFNSTNYWVDVVFSDTLVP
jgi:hypothetical protein